jgi:hypothetical protein
MNDEACERLSHAIVIQAIYDFRKTVKRIKKCTDDPDKLDKNIRELKSIIRFFKSDWYTLLVNFDSKTLINKLISEIDDNTKSILQDNGIREITNKCCICGEEYTGHGNNARPIKNDYCCDKCNAEIVIPARLKGRM